MSSDYIGKTLAELRVCDLKVELEKRELETTGVKPSLVSRLEKALIEEGHDPSAYVFNGDTKIESIAQEVPTTESNCDSVDIVKDEPIESNDNADAEVIEVDEKKEDEPIVEAIESVEPTEPTEPIEEVKQETEIESNNDNDQEHLQLTVVDADKLDTSNVDNEDSLNLTIGEEEAKIFQDEEADEKIKESNIEDKSNGNDTSADGKNGSSGNVHSGDNNKTFKSNVSSKKDDGKTDRNDINELDDGDNAAQDNEEDIVDGTSGSGGGSKKGDESETKTSPSKTLKDDKETSSKASNNLSSTSSTKISSTPASRNLWVSGLSSLTRATDLKIIFSKFGKVIGAKVVTNTRTPGTRCFGYVTMNSSTDATKCITNLHRTELHGRIISVERAKSDIGNIGNKTKRVQGSQEAKVTDDEKRTSQATSDRSKKAKDDELTEKSGGSSDNSKSASNNNNNNNKALTNKEKPADGASDASKTPANNATSEKDEAGAQSDAGATGKQTKSSSQRNDGSKRPAQPDRTRRPTDAERAAARRDRKRERDRAAVLSYRKIKEERERTRMRERERKLREEERHRAAERRRNRDEEERLKKERNKLRDERLRLEREKADLLRLERERQKLEREKIELERLELKRQQLKIEEARRAMKRPAFETYRYNDIDRKRSSNDRRFDPPPPPKISIYPSNSTKRSEDYKSSSRSSISNDCRGNSEMSSSFKRPINDGYSKRSNDIDQTSRSTSAYAQRSGVPQMSSSGKEHRFNESDSRSGGSNFARHRVDDRESRGSAPSRKSRYMEGHSNGNSNERYDRQQSSSSPAWNNGPPSSVKSFNANELWGALGKVPQNQESNNWGRMENQNQERYDRTYNERNPKYMDSNTNASNSGNRPTSFINNSRTQDRYNMPNRFDGGRF